MQMTKIALATSLSALLIGAAHAVSDGAGHGHDAHSVAMNHSSMNHGSSQMFLEKRDVNGYTVSFHVMEANEGMKNGGSHNLMVKVEQGANVVTELKANSKVVYPDGSDQSKPLMKMGDWLIAGYDLKPGGKHQLMVLFMTPDGKKHFGGVYYGQ